MDRCVLLVDRAKNVVAARSSELGRGSTAADIDWATDLQITQYQAEMNEEDQVEEKCCH